MWAQTLRSLAGSAWMVISRASAQSPDYVFDGRAAICSAGYDDFLAQ